MKEYLSTSGRIFDIQRYSIHDGPGIRTIVFLKGCALRCRWCCNPESQSFEVETMMINGKPKVMGKDVTVAEVMETVERDMPYYLQSGGGITLSGGECTLQRLQSGRLHSLPSQFLFSLFLLLFLSLQPQFPSRHFLSLQLMRHCCRILPTKALSHRMLRLYVL